MPRTRLMTLFLGLVLMLGFASAIAPAASAAPTGSTAAAGGPVKPAGCGVRDGGNVLAPPGSWYQLARATVCDNTATTKTVSVKLLFTPCCGFASGNVVDCIANLTLIHIGGSSDTKQVSCKAAAQASGGGWSGTYTWTIGAPSGNYQVKGYANVITGSTYSGYGNQSVTAVFGT